MSFAATQFLNPPAPILAFAFNKARNMVAISPNSEKVYIFEKSGDSWDTTPKFVLDDHDKLVTGIDWAPETNRIVTCSQDRNSYVWNYDQASNVWKPKLVILRINRAATCVKWSPDEKKFAVASGARVISVCYYEEANDWWVSKHIKKPLRSTILSLDWHPNSVLLAAGSADFKARIFFAGIKEVEQKKPELTAWGGKLSFGDCVQEYSAGSFGGWVHGVAFSGDGSKLAWVGHGSHLSVVDSANPTEVTTICVAGLPFTSLLWLTDSSIVAVGHDANIHLFSRGSGQWKYDRTLDTSASSSAGTATTGSAMDKFRQLDLRGQEGNDAKLPTVHQNMITSISTFTGPVGGVQQFATSGLDGQIVTWTVKSIEAAIAGLKIA